MIVVDVETTGSNPYKHSIVSIGAVEFENPRNQFYKECKVFEGAEIELEAMKVNGFSYAQVNDPTKQSLEDIIKEFLAWTSSFQNKTIIAHNAGFDTKFIEASCQRYGIYYPFGFRSLDVHSVVIVDVIKRGEEIPLIYGSSAFSLNKVLDYCGLPREPDPHNALTGAKCELEAMYRMLYGKFALDEFKDFKLPEYLQKTKQATLF